MAFLLFSWPFFYFPLTDGDIAHWVPWATEIRLHHNFLSAPSDQAHGPLLAWTGSVFGTFSPHSFYAYALFTILCGVLTVATVYAFAQKLWRNAGLSQFAAVVFMTSLAAVYFTRTPMYDWPATTFFFAFCYFYYVYTTEGHYRNLGLALGATALASLCRFSIGLGLSGLFMIIVGIIYRKPFHRILRDGVLILVAGAAVNLPWLWVQSHVFGEAFVQTFFRDNLGRFITDNPGDPIHRDYYGFLVYALVGTLPYLFLVLTSLFQKRLWKWIAQHRGVQALIATFLPCLIFFSFSGHTKLARYIAYVFPGMMLFFAAHWYLVDLAIEKYRKRLNWMFGISGVLTIILLLIQVFQFSAQARSAVYFSLCTFAFVLGLLATAFWAVWQWKAFLSHPLRTVAPMVAVYLFFFTALTYFSFRVSFLNDVRLLIQGLL